MHFDLEVLDQNLFLLPEKAIYWKQKKTLIVADVHIGKSGHFRKHGIPVSNEVNSDNLYRLSKLIREWETNRIIFLGDLFHSYENLDWTIFWEWEKESPEIDLILTMGNHDDYQKDLIAKSRLIQTDVLKDSPFIFVHDNKLIEDESSHFILSGHIHPSVKIRGKGRQSLRLSCFVFDGYHILLPAFGSFTGTHSINQTEGIEIFGIIEDSVIQL